MCGNREQRFYNPSYRFSTFFHRNEHPFMVYQTHHDDVMITIVALCLAPEEVTIIPGTIVRMVVARGQEHPSRSHPSFHIGLAAIPMRDGWRLRSTYAQLEQMVDAPIMPCCRYITK